MFDIAYNTVCELDVHTSLADLEAGQKIII